MAVVFGENGGFLAQNNLLFVPVQDPATKATYIGLIDPSNLDDPVDGSLYVYRAEDIVVMRMPTIRRIGIIYRDLGPAKLGVMIQGMNDANQVVTSSVTIQLGNPIPTFATLNAFADISLSAYRPQVVLSRAPGQGPVSIISLTVWGEIDDTAP